MKDKGLIISWPILILTGNSNLYIYVGKPLEKELDSGLVAMIVACSALIIYFFF